MPSSSKIPLASNCSIEQKIKSPVIEISGLLIFPYLLAISYSFSSFNTIVGAIPGALPPLGGWVAATNQINLDGTVYKTAGAQTYTTAAGDKILPTNIKRNFD